MNVPQSHHRRRESRIPSHPDQGCQRAVGSWCSRWTIVLVCLAGCLCAGEPGPAVQPAVQTEKQVVAAYRAHVRATKGILDIRTIHRSTLGANGMDLVIVSAGFTAAEQGRFLQFSEEMKESLFKHGCWRRYRDWVNLHVVCIDDESPEKTRLGVTGYDGKGLGCDGRIAWEYAMTAAAAEGVLVLHNSSFSRATCGPWGVTTYNCRDAIDSTTAAHELGHALAGLGDEYIQHDGAFTGTAESMHETVNVTTEPNPRLSKWHYWTVDTWPGPLAPMAHLGNGVIENHEGAGWPQGMFRPERSCIMRDGRREFCTVCDESMQASIFRHTELFEQVQPGVGDHVLWQGESLAIRVAAIAPLRTPDAGHRSRLDLYMDGNKVASSSRGEVEFRLDSTTMPPGVYQLGALLTVQTDAVRRDFGFLSASKAWRVEILPHARPVVEVPAQVQVAPRGMVDLPITIRHPDPSRVGLRLQHAPDGAVLADGRLRWQAGDQQGSWRVDVIATLADREVVASLDLRVASPAIAGTGVVITPAPPVEALVGKPLAVKPDVRTTNGAHLRYSAHDLPEGATLDRYTGEVTWTPTWAQGGPHLLTFLVHDGRENNLVRLAVYVTRPARPSLASYLNTHASDSVANLARWQQGPLVYQRLFESLRLLRDRYRKIHEPALAAAQQMYAELSPTFQANVREQLRMHAWSFFDKPEVIEWMRRLAEEGSTAEHQELARQLDLMATVVQLRQNELTGTREQLVPLSRALIGTTEPLVAAGLRRAIAAIRQRTADDAACRTDLLAVLRDTTGPGRAALVGLLPIATVPEDNHIFETLAKDPDPQVAKTAQEMRDHLAGLGRTAGFVTAWKVSEPYVAKDFHVLFDQSFDVEGGTAQIPWQPLMIPLAADGTRVADFTRRFGGTLRAVYLTTTLRSTRTQQVGFVVGSDDGVKVWLNGELLHENKVIRPLNPGDDRFRARLKEGDNVVLCKVVQSTGDWGFCMSVRANDGGPALGITVIDQ